MSDCEETDVFLRQTPGKEKKKKNSKRDKKCLKRKNNMSMKTDESIQKKKKKKNSKFKDAMEGRKEKKKGKKKIRLLLGLDDSLIHTQAKPAVKPQTLNKHSVDKLKPDHDCKKKSRREKKVAFDLSPDISSVKPPRCVSSSQQSPKKSIPSETAAVRDGERTGHSHGQTPAHESQCSSEDINSQDLFITQKTFRALPSQPSSSESSDDAFSPTPPVFTPPVKLHTSMAQKTQHPGGSYKCPQDSHSHQHHRTTKEHVQKPKTLQVLLKEEEEEEQLSKAHQDLKKWKWFPFKANINEERKASRPAHTTPTVNAYLSETFDQSPSLDVAKSKKHSRSSSQQPPSCVSHEPSVPPPMSTGSTSTQTENFFTTQLSSYLNFCQKTRVTVHLEDLQPVDLSLPQRARNDLGTCLSVETFSLPGELKGRNPKEPNLHPSGSSHMKDAVVKEEPSDHHPWPGSTQGKRGTSLSPQSDSEPKSADLTTSSEDEPPWRLDLTQVRAVQMRLNESFFFKTKGEGQSPRPESPLMKLVQGREVKSRKRH